MKFGKLPKFGSIDSTIYVRKGEIENSFYFEKKGETFGFFKKTPLGWLWCINAQAQRFNTLSELLDYAAEALENV